MTEEIMLSVRRYLTLERSVELSLCYTAKGVKVAEGDAGQITNQLTLKPEMCWDLNHNTKWREAGWACEEPLN